MRERAELPSSTSIFAQNTRNNLTLWNGSKKVDPFIKMDQEFKGGEDFDITLGRGFAELLCSVRRAKDNNYFKGKYCDFLTDLQKLANLTHQLQVDAVLDQLQVLNKHLTLVQDPKRTQEEKKSDLFDGLIIGIILGLVVSAAILPILGVLLPFEANLFLGLWSFLGLISCDPATIVVMLAIALIFFTLGTLILGGITLATQGLALPLLLAMVLPAPTLGLIGACLGYFDLKPDPTKALANEINRQSNSLKANIHTYFQNHLELKPEKETLLAQNWSPATVTEPRPVRNF